MKKHLAAIVISSLLLQAGCLLAADTPSAKDQLDDLVKKVQTKLSEGHRSEADLKDELGQFDKIVAEHKAEKSDEVAQVLFMKAMLYLQVLNDPDKAEAAVEQVKKDFPDTKQGKSADQMLESIKQQAASKKIQAGLVEGSTFPVFNETDLAGKPLSPANYKGKVLLIDFWATWCGPCVGELPNVKKVYDKYHPKGFEIIGISLDKEKQKLTDFLKSKEIPWAQYFDGKGWANKLAAKYGVQSIPATYLLDGSGKIIGRDLRGEELEQAVSKAIGAKAT
jgi:thiol-disulfide isomerase/thioredoxin